MRGFFVTTYKFSSETLCRYTIFYLTKTRILIFSSYSVKENFREISMDKNNFSDLYSASRKDLYKYCRTLCGNDADDLMQQTYMKALENLEKLYDENFPAWLRSVARNIFLDNLTPHIN